MLLSGRREVGGSGGKTDDAAKGVELLLTLVAATVAGRQKVDILLFVLRITDTETREAECLKTTCNYETVRERLKTTDTTAQEHLRTTLTKPLRSA